MMSQQASQWLVTIAPVGSLFHYLERSEQASALSLEALSRRLNMLIPGNLYPDYYWRTLSHLSP